MTGVPALRRDELLNFAKIAEILKSAPETDEFIVIDALKRQAKNEGVSLRDMQSLITRVKSDIKKQSAPVIEAPSCLPEMFENGDFNPCGYAISDDGIYTYLGEHIVQVCPHPIFPYRILRDITTREEQVQLIFYTDGEWRDDITVSRQTISSTRSIVGLSARGIMVNDENARYLIKYLCDIEVNNRDIIPSVYSVQSLGKTRLGYVPYCDAVVYGGENSDNRRRFELYREHGDFEKWRTLQNEMCRHVIPRIVIAAGYASLLLGEMQLNPFGLHLWGSTGKGKSVAVMASASIYGYPDIKNGIVYTGNATGNGLESRLAFVQNCCFYLDELSLLSAKQIDDMVMLIMQGQGKLRMTRTGESRETYYWNCASVSNSEMPITNDFSKGGVFNRIIQIKPDGSVFGDMDLPNLADALRSDYGFGAKRFIDAVQATRELIPDLRRKYYDEVIKFTEDKQANAASLLLTAYEIARMFIYKSDTRLTAQDIIPFLHSPDEISQAMRVYDKFIAYVQANYKMFDDSDIGATGQKWGQIAKHRDVECVDIFPHRLDEFFRIVVKEMPVAQFLDEIDERGLLVRSKDKRTFPIRIDDKVQKVYAIKFCNPSEGLQKGVTEKTDDSESERTEQEKLKF